MSSNDIAKQEVFKYCKAMLGDGMIDVELDPIHYETALIRALGVFRQRSDNAVEESYLHLTLTESQNEYILPKEVQQVRQIFRRSVGSRTGNGTGGSVFEPFSLAYTNTYLLSSTNMGGLLTYELFSQYQELVGKMFGSYINFTYHPQSHKLVIQQRPRGEESVMLLAYNTKPDFAIIDDTYAGQWVKDYTLANCKMMLGQAREKFASIAGPQGGTALNGAAIKQEGQNDIDRLTIELTTQVSGGNGYTWVIG
jgi:hypothetical protein|tara:strand:- start:5142 stop:5900 length:759 start_codon:yes stop_codon:yes gene_type:complete